MPRPVRPLDERFWEKVRKTDGCWLWTGSGKYRKGQPEKMYGTMAVHGKGRKLSTHVAWYLATGEWPTQMVLHRCDNPPCVRYDHLFLGTNADNLGDAAAKGLFPRGETHYLHRLTEEKVRLIREMPAKGFSWAEIARAMGVHVGTVQAVIQRKTWKHVV